MSERFAVMGAGEVGFHLARTLSQEGHSVVVIERDPAKKDRVEEALDAAVVLGNGAHMPVLEAAKVDHCDLFMAVSSSDEANLAASLLAKRLGAKRTVVRVGVVDDVTIHRRLYEETFAVDMLLSTQLLATTRILNHILGHNTLEVEYLAQGKIQLRRIHLESGSVLTRKSLKNVRMPAGSLVVAFFHGDKLIIPSGDDVAQPGDDVLVLCKAGVISKVERMISGTQSRGRGTVVIAGGGATCETVTRALSKQIQRIKIIEKDRHRARELSQQFRRVQVLHGDATDSALFRAEKIADARALIALTGNDDSNLMACLLAQDFGVPEAIALVQHTETSALWHKLGLIHVVSPRLIAAERIRNYIQTDYNANIVSLKRGEAQVFERRLAAASPAAGVTLAELEPPKGVIVGAVARGNRVFVPRGTDRLLEGDVVILFVQEEHVPTIQLLFPGRDLNDPLPVHAAG